MIPRLKQLKDEAVAKFRQELFDEWDNGVTQTELAKKHGCTFQVIGMHLREHPEYIKKYQEGRPCGSREEMARQIVKMRDVDKMTFAAISKHFGRKRGRTHGHSVPTIMRVYCEYLDWKLDEKLNERANERTS